MFEPGKMYRLTEPVKNTRFDYFAGIDQFPKYSNCRFVFIVDVFVFLICLATLIQ